MKLLIWEAKPGEVRNLESDRTSFANAAETLFSFSIPSVKTPVCVTRPDRVQICFTHSFLVLFAFSTLVMKLLAAAPNRPNAIQHDFSGASSSLGKLQLF